MRSIIAGIIILSLFFSCNNSTPTTQNNETNKPQVATNDSLEKMALQHLYGKISKLPNTSLKDNEILIGSNSIRIKINVEFDGHKDGKWIYAANIITFYKSSEETQIDVGSIGIGLDKNEAINVCIQEWFTIFGIPFTNMFNGDKSLSVSNMKVFSGLMGIRGNLPENTWLNGNDEMTEKIISQIQQQIQNTEGHIIPIDIKLMIGKNGVTDGECRIDNQISAQLLNDLKQINWPSSEEGFMFKQFYLVEKNSR